MEVFKWATSKVIVKKMGNDALIWCNRNKGHQMNDYVEKGESSFFFLFSTAKQARRQEAMKYKQKWKYTVKSVVWSSDCAKKRKKESLVILHIWLAYAKKKNTM